MNSSPKIPHKAPHIFLFWAIILFWFSVFQGGLANPQSASLPTPATTQSTQPENAFLQQNAFGTVQNTVCKGPKLRTLRQTAAPLQQNSFACFSHPEKLLSPDLPSGTIFNTLCQYRAFCLPHNRQALPSWRGLVTYALPPPPA